MRYMALLMYNKIFTKILDSSIWLETDSTRIVWLTLIAAMDETGFTQFASPANLAHRARVSLEAVDSAIKVLEGPDANSSDPDHEGRRIERVPGGWMVLNAGKYRELVTRAVIQEKTRERVARHRAKTKPVTKCNAPVTPSNVSVTQSEAVADTTAIAVPSWLVAPWKEWTDFRKEKHIKPYAPIGAKKQINRLLEMGEAQAIAAINFSIAQNYQGIFEEKKNDQRTNFRSATNSYVPPDAAAAERLRAF